MQPLNLQPPEKYIDRYDKRLDVVDLFPTIQGEGPWAGTPATFIRLAGCNLACDLCDTDYTSNRKFMAIDEILEQVKKHRYNLVVLTGGEPFRQDITPLAKRIIHISNTIQIQIETNGTLFPSETSFWDSWTRSFPHIGRVVSIVCSPKTPKIAEGIKPYIHALKYVIAAGKVSPDDGLPLTILGNDCYVARPWGDFIGEIFIQPEDNQDPIKNQANLQAAISICMKHKYRLSLQQHKTIGLP